MAAYTTRQRSRQSGVFLAVLVIFAAVVPQACGAFIPGLYPPSRSWRGWAGVKNVFVLYVMKDTQNKQEADPLQRRLLV